MRLPLLLLLASTTVYCCAPHSPKRPHPTQAVVTPSEGPKPEETTTLPEETTLPDETLPGPTTQPGETLPGPTTQPGKTLPGPTTQPGEETSSGQTTQPGETPEEKLRRELEEKIAEKEEQIKKLNLIVTNLTTAKEVAEEEKKMAEEKEATADALAKDKQKEIDELTQNLETLTVAEKKAREDLKMMEEELTAAKQEAKDKQKADEIAAKKAKLAAAWRDVSNKLQKTQHELTAKKLAAERLAVNRTQLLLEGLVRKMDVDRIVAQLRGMLRLKQDAKSKSVLDTKRILDKVNAALADGRMAVAAEKAEVKEKVEQLQGRMRNCGFDLACIREVLLDMNDLKNAEDEKVKAKERKKTEDKYDKCFREASLFWGSDC